MHDPDTRHEWVSVKQAAIHFGTSESDIRRRIRRGELTSESLTRPGGTLLRVRLPASDDTALSETDPASDTHQHDPDPRPDIASGLLERLAAQDATIAAKDAEIARINAEARILAERAARAEARAEMLAADLERERARRWWWWLLGR